MIYLNMLRKNVKTYLWRSGRREEAIAQLERAALCFILGTSTICQSTSGTSTTWHVDPVAGWSRGTSITWQVDHVTRRSHGTLITWHVDHVARRTRDIHLWHLNSVAFERYTSATWHSHNTVAIWRPNVAWQSFQLRSSWSMLMMNVCESWQCGTFICDTTTIRHTGNFCGAEYWLVLHYFIVQFT